MGKQQCWILSPQPHWWLLIMLWGPYSVVELLRVARSTNPARRIKSLQSINRNLEQLLMSLRRRSVFFTSGSFLRPHRVQSRARAQVETWECEMWIETETDHHLSPRAVRIESCQNEKMHCEKKLSFLCLASFSLSLWALLQCLVCMFGHTVWTFFVASVHFCSRSGFNQQQRRRRRWFGLLASRNNFSKWFLLKELSLSSLTYHLS